MVRGEIIDRICAEASADAAARARSLADSHGNLIDELVTAGFAAGRVLDVAAQVCGVEVAAQEWLRLPETRDLVARFDADVCKQVRAAPVATLDGWICVAYADPEMLAQRNELGFPPHLPYLALPRDLENAFALLRDDDRAADAGFANMPRTRAADDPAAPDADDGGFDDGDAPTRADITRAPSPPARKPARTATRPPSPSPVAPSSLSARASPAAPSSSPSSSPPPSPVAPSSLSARSSPAAPSSSPSARSSPPAPSSSPSARPSPPAPSSPPSPRVWGESGESASSSADSPPPPSSRAWGESGESASAAASESASSSSSSTSSPSVRPALQRKDPVAGGARRALVEKAQGSAGSGSAPSSSSSSPSSSGRPRFEPLAPVVEPVSKKAGGATAGAEPPSKKGTSAAEPVSKKAADIGAEPTANRATSGAAPAPKKRTGMIVEPASKNVAPEPPEGSSSSSRPRTFEPLDPVLAPGGAVKAAPGPTPLRPRKEKPAAPEGELVAVVDESVAARFSTTTWVGFGMAVVVTGALLTAVFRPFEQPRAPQLTVEQVRARDQRELVAKARSKDDGAAFPLLEKAIALDPASIDARDALMERVRRNVARAHVDEANADLAALAQRPDALAIESFLNESAAKLSAAQAATPAAAATTGPAATATATTTKASTAPVPAPKGAKAP